MSRHVNETAKRYLNPDICQHLAGQYAAGVLTPKVKARVETLRHSSQVLDSAIAQWADNIADIHAALPQPHAASADLWERIDTQISQPKASPKESTTPWWRELFLWQISTFATTSAAIILGLMLLLSSPELPINAPLDIQSASYMAPMSSQQAGEIQLVVSAYKGAEPGTSELHIQWSKRAQADHPRELHLWAEDRETGVLTYLGATNPEKKHWQLNKERWQAVANSVQLLATATNQEPTGKQAVFIGPCVQLKPWKTSA